MLIYVIRTGNLYDMGRFIGQGYSGNNMDPRIPGLNNPAFVMAENHGPLPPGGYTLGSPFTHPHTGAYTMRLRPDPKNNMGNPPRDGFMMHGDNVQMNHSASDGCIVMFHNGRVNANTACAPSRRLQVVKEESDRDKILSPEIGV
jgi:hypothetical protein